MDLRIMSTSPNILLIEKDWLFKIFISTKHRLYRHLLLIAFISLVTFTSKPLFTEPILTYIRLWVVAMFLLLFYTNMYVLLPKFFFKSRYLSYSFWVAVITAVISVLYSGSWYVLAPYKGPGVTEGAVNVLSLSFVVIILVSASTGIKLFQRMVTDNMKINELEKLTMRSEMEQLKSQINPHFLFNMLNNANVLTQKDPVKASQVLMKLSDLLRYQLYDSARSSVLLTADIHFIEDFLGLEQIRRDNFKYVISKQGELSGVQIAPLLLITFVENAIKHNVDIEKPSYVHLDFNVYKNELHFKCINSKPLLTVTKKDVGGLGLANVRRRLELIYPKRHTLQMNDNTESYNVSLTISL